MDTHATTILAVKKDNHVAMAGDGQVTLGQTMIMKHTAQKVRRLYEGRILAGFAGATADAFTLFELFEAKLREVRGNLLRAAVEMTKEWRRDKYLRKLEAMLLLADSEHLLARATSLNPMTACRPSAAAALTLWPPPERSSGTAISTRKLWPASPCVSPRKSACTPTTT